MKVALLPEFVAVVLATGCLPCALQTAGGLIPGFSFNAFGQASGQASAQAAAQAANQAASQAAAQAAGQAAGHASGYASASGSLSAFISAEIQPYGLNCQVQGHPEAKAISVNADGTCGIQGTGTVVAFTFGQAFQWATGGLVCSVDREGGPIIVKPLKETPAMNIYHGWQAQAGFGGEVHFEGYDNYMCHDKICAFPTGKAAPSACTPTTVTTTPVSEGVQPPPTQVPLAPLKSYNGHPESPPVETAVHAPKTYEPVPVGTGETEGQGSGNYSYGTNGSTSAEGTTPPASDETYAGGAEISGAAEAGAEGTGEGAEQEEEDGLSGLSSTNLSASSLPANKKLSASNDAAGSAASFARTILAGLGVALLAIVM